MDYELEHSPRSWLDNFTQPFSWRSSLSPALDFLNKLFLPGVNSSATSLNSTFFQILIHCYPSKNALHKRIGTKLKCNLYVHRAKISIEHVKIAENDPKICKKN